MQLEQQLAQECIPVTLWDGFARALRWVNRTPSGPAGHSTLTSLDPAQTRPTQGNATLEGTMPEEPRVMSTPVRARSSTRVRGSCFGTIALAAAVSVAGCAWAPHQPEPVPVMPIALDVPGAWSAADVAPGETAPSLTQWWRAFGDPLLTGLVGEAVEANTSVTRAQAALRQARAQSDRVAAGLSPTLGSSASAQRGMSGGRSTGNNFKVGLDASWELDVFDANRGALQASVANARAAMKGRRP